MCMNLFFWSSFPEDCSDDGHLCEARALHAAAGHFIGDIGLRNVPEVPALSQERDRLCLRHVVLLLPPLTALHHHAARWLDLLIAAVYHKYKPAESEMRATPPLLIQPVVYM